MRIRLTKKNIILATLLFISFFTFHVAQVNADQNCAIEKTSFGYIDDDPNEKLYRSAISGGNFVRLTITTNGECIGDQLYLRVLGIKEDESGGPEDQNSFEVVSSTIDENEDSEATGSQRNLNPFTPQGEKVSIVFQLDEAVCWKHNRTKWGYPCVNFIKIYKGSGNQNLLYDSNANNFLKPVLVKKSYTENEKVNKYPGVLFGNCSTAWCNNKNWKFAGISSISDGVDLVDVDTCKIEPEDVYFEYPSGSNQIKNFFNLIIKPKDNGCDNIPLKLYLSNPTLGRTSKVDFDNHGHFMYFAKKPGEKIVLKMQGNGDSCRNAYLFDCKIGVNIATEGGTPLYDSTPQVNALYLEAQNTIPSSEENYEQKRKNYLQERNYENGLLFKDCSPDGDESCDTEAWRLVGVDGAQQSNGDDLNTSAAQIEAPTEPIFDPNSPCYVAAGQPLGNGETAGDKGGYDVNCYELLAPIPGAAESYVDGDGNIRSTGFGSIDANGRQAVNLSGLQIGDYVNTIITIALGMLIVLSIVMIIVAGVEYMTVESIYGKSHAKQRIGDAVTGLLIGLGIFLMLETINPRLLEVNFVPAEVKIDAHPLDLKQMEFVQGVDSSAVSIPPDGTIFSYEPLIMYLYHQQGEGGAPAIIWAAKKGLPTVPADNPYAKSSSIQSNMSKNYPGDCRQKKALTPSSFVECWYQKVKYFEPKTGNIPSKYAQPIEQAASERGFNTQNLKIMCMIESYECTKNVANNYGYKGLFQLSNNIFQKFGKSGSKNDIFNPYQNAYAAIGYANYNLKKFAKDF